MLFEILSIPTAFATSLVCNSFRTRKGRTFVKQNVGSTFVTYFSNVLPWTGNGICDANFGSISVKWVLKEFAMSLASVIDSDEFSFILGISELFSFCPSNYLKPSKYA